MLNTIGFKNATQKEIADANYFTVIGEAKTLHPQTGFADWNQDFPNPVDFYGVLLDGKSILPTDNENFGQTNDPYINKIVTKLGATPTTELGSGRRAVAGARQVRRQEGVRRGLRLPVVPVPHLQPYQGELHERHLRLGSRRDLSQVGLLVY